MTEKERYEEELLKNCIQEAFGCSDDQLLAELDEIEANLSDDEFPGLEERMYGKLMERVRAEESVVVEDTEETGSAEVNLDTDTEEKSEPVVRFRKRKKLAVIALAAAFVGVLGGTAIGDRNYFFRGRTNERGFVLNNENSFKQRGDLVSAYEEIKNDFAGKCLVLNSWPEGMTFDCLERGPSRATITFEYLGNKIYFIQVKKEKISSISVQSDKEMDGQVTNVWLGKDIDYSKYKLEDGSIEYEAKIIAGEITCWLRGKMTVEEFEDMLKNINYY